MDLAEVTLKTGAAAPRVLVKTKWLSLRELLRQNPIAFYELAEACRDRSHVLFGETGKDLTGWGLVEQINADGTVMINESVRNIIVASVAGEDLACTLAWPLSCDTGSGVEM